MNTIEFRLAALERSALRWKTATILLLTLISAGTLIAAAKTTTTEFDVIRAHRIEVVDSEGGKAKVEIHANDGVAAIEATGPDDKQRFMIGVDSYNTTLGLCRGPDSTPILMKVDKDRAQITLSDEIYPAGPASIRNQHLILLALKAGCGIQYVADNGLGAVFDFSRKRAIMAIGTPTGKSQAEITGDLSSSRIRLIDGKGTTTYDSRSVPPASQPTSAKK